MKILKMKGLVFPDEYIIKYFFKKKFNKIKSNVLELGCSNGNNLNLFFEYGWNVTGVDNNSKCISNANSNFKYNKKKNFLKNQFKFICEDMLTYIKNLKKIRFKLIIFANSIYYLTYDEILKILLYLRKKINKKTNVFFRIRLNGDYRQKYSKKIAKNTYLINFKTTNEFKCKNTFFIKKDFIDLIKKNLKPKSMTILNCQYENLINKKIILNKDLIVWCII